MSKDTEATYTDGKWEFNESVTNCFEDMLERSIPQYSVMRQSMVDLIGQQYNHDDYFELLDVGCSNGLNIQYIRDNFESCDVLGIDCSVPMLSDASMRFSKDNLVKCIYMDLREEFPQGTFNVVTSILSIMFTPINYRQQIIQSVYDSLDFDGMFIMVEKVLGESAYLNNMQINIYHDMKKQNGYTQEQIDRKKLALEGVQVPVTNSWNIELLKQAGFRQVDVFWRWMNFVGYIAIK